MICFLTKYLLLPQRMDGWSPTYRAERVKVIGRLINLTPNQNQGWIARPFRKKLAEEVTCPLSEAVDARGAEKRAIFITEYFDASNQASNPTSPSLARISSDTDSNRHNGPHILDRGPARSDLSNSRSVAQALNRLLCTIF